MFPKRSSSLTLVKGSRMMRAAKISPEGPRIQMTATAIAAAALLCSAAGTSLLFYGARHTGWHLASKGALILLPVGLVLALGVSCVTLISMRRKVKQRVATQYYQRLAYAAVDNANRHLNGILESSPDAIASVDTELRWTAFNQKYAREFEDSFGCEPQLGEALPEALAGRAEDDTPLALWKRTLAGESFSTTEKVTDVARGNCIHEVRYFPIRNSAGVPTAACYMSRDVTEVRAAEELLLRQSEQLKRSNAELEQFAYVASHDLQEPLRMVASYMQLLAQRYHGKLDEKADKYIDYAVDGARRMQTLISDLLALSRVNSRGAEFKNVDCEEVLAQVLHDLSVPIRETNAAVLHDPLPVVCGDARQISQVLQNLIGNALKFHGPETPRIHVSAEYESGMWRFQIRDNGIGIAPEHFQRIFLMFQRLHSRQEYGGTGIGLAICKKILERHGGRIWVESQTGCGATFYFTLPGAPYAERTKSDVERSPVCL